MLIVGLMLGIIIVVGIIFAIVKSVAMKLLAMLLLVISLVLVVALSSEKIGQIVKPISMDKYEIQIYVEGEPIKFKIDEVRRVDAVNGEKGIVVSFVVEGYLHEVTVSKLAYEWRIKNSLKKEFGNRMYDSTF